MAEGQTSPTKYILIGCAIALALGVCGVGSCMALVGGGAFFAYEKTEAPAAEARLFLQAVEDGDLPATLTHVSSGLKARATPEKLSDSVLAAGLALPDIVDVTFPGRGLTPQGVHLTGVVATSGGQIGVEVDLIEEAGKWRVDHAVIGSEPFPMGDKPLGPEEPTPPLPPAVPGPPSAPAPAPAPAPVPAPAPAPAPEQAQPPRPNEPPQQPEATPQPVQSPKPSGGPVPARAPSQPRIPPAHPVK